MLRNQRRRAVIEGLRVACSDDGDRTGEVLLRTTAICHSRRDVWLPGGSKLYLAVMPKPLLVLAAGNYVFFSAVQLNKQLSSPQRIELPNEGQFFRSRGPRFCHCWRGVEHPSGVCLYFFFGDSRMQ